VAQISAYQLSLLRRLRQGLPVSEHAEADYIALAHHGYVTARPVGNRIVFMLTDDGYDALAENGLSGAATDLYAVAEELRTKQPRYRDVYFEERGDGSLVMETELPGVHVSVIPHRKGRRRIYSVEFSWRYPTQWDEYESAEEEMGEYKTPRGAVERAMTLTLWTDREIREVFHQDY